MGKFRRCRRRACDHRPGRRRTQILSKLVQHPTCLERESGSQRETLQLGSGEFITRLPVFIPDPAADAAITFVVADLLQPETGYGAVEHAEKLQMLLLCRVLRKLD